MIKRPIFHSSILAASLVSITPIAYGQSTKVENKTLPATKAELSVNKQKMLTIRKKRDLQLVMTRAEMKNPQRRALMTKRMEETEKEYQKTVEERAKMKGLPLRGTREDGIEFLLIDFDDKDSPIYIQTENENAAISTATDLVRSNSTYNNVEGSSVNIGIWEASGIPRASHQEYTGRLTVLDGTTTTSGHATHVAGTLAAAGINSDAKGMAPAATVSAFTVSGFNSEFMANAAVQPNTNQLYISNHSYGVGQGWENNTFRGTFVDDGNPDTNFEDDFGNYSSSAVIWDILSHNFPYHLLFNSAGNQRSNDAPSNGTEWTHEGTTYIYDSSVHPQGDGDYKDGWDNMEGRSISKNSMVVGNTQDAVQNGVRRASNAITIRSSSRGPADDGRIKPDIVANGVSLLSANDTGNDDYSNRTGTSMSTPNACGSAALLIDYYSTRFPGQSMLASTLKGLIIHTADDDGNPGPDYRYGWGLMNTQAAADVIRGHADNNGGALMLETSINDTTTTSRTHTFAYDGNSPLKVTLSWTDPAGAVINGHDNRQRALVNDLNVRVQGPDGTHFPYVMPFVGDWSVGSIDDDAVTGVNTVDPVEQVFLPTPQAGVYTVTVDFVGNLTNDFQDYSLIVTGQTATEIAVESNGPPVIELEDNSGTQNLGSTAASTPLVKSFTIMNTGGSPLTGLSLSSTGAHAEDFTFSNLTTTELDAAENTTFDISFSPSSLGTRSATIRIASNDADEAVFDINLTATGITELEAWRIARFGDDSNTQGASDNFDFDNDGLSNLNEFLFGSDPTVPNPQAIAIDLTETTATVTYDRSVNATSEYDFQVMWANDLSNGVIWSGQQVTEEILSDNGIIQEARATIPLDESLLRRFFRVQATAK